MSVVFRAWVNMYNNYGGGGQMGYGQQPYPAAAPAAGSYPPPGPGYPPAASTYPSTQQSPAPVGFVPPPGPGYTSASQGPGYPPLDSGPGYPPAGPGPGYPPAGTGPGYPLAGPGPGYPPAGPGYPPQVGWFSDTMNWLYRSSFFTYACCWIPEICKNTLSAKRYTLMLLCIVVDFRYCHCFCGLL